MVRRSGAVPYREIVVQRSADRVDTAKRRGWEFRFGASTGPSFKVHYKQRKEEHAKARRTCVRAFLIALAHAQRGGGPPYLPTF